MDELNRAISAWVQPYGWSGEAIFCLLLAAATGGLIGLERELRGREAGFRTNLLVCVGSTLVMLVSKRFAEVDWPHVAGVNINVDPARIAYSVMTGVGFLGAGAILKHNGSVRGLTTAAAMWCVAAIGLAIGFGMYVIAALTAVLVLAALWLLDYLENVLPSRQHRKLTLRCAWESGCVQQLVQRLREARVEVVDQGFVRSADLAQVDVHLVVTFTKPARYHELERQLQADPRCLLIAAEKV